MPDSGRGPVVRSALARCVGSATDEFAGKYWGERPLLSRAVDLGSDFSDLFTADAVDELVTRRALRTPFVRMANEGSVLPPARYTGSGGFGAEIGDQLDSEKVLREFAGGSTIVLQGLHRTWSPITDFTRHLVHDLGHPCQVNAYVTPASSRGFDPHYDVHDVFVIQIHGEKRWKIHAPVHPDPLATQPWQDHGDSVARQAAGPAVIEETLRPGDVLYLPRGWIHAANALGSTSIHLTVGIAALTRHDIVDRLVADAADTLSLRHSLPLGIDVSDPAELESIVREVVGDLISRLEPGRKTSTAVAEHLARHLRASSQPESVRPIATIDALGALDETSSVSWRNGLAARIDTDGAAARILLARTTVTMPIEAADALLVLHSGKAVVVGDLPGLDAASSVVVVKRLVREGILVVR